MILSQGLILSKQVVCDRLCEKTEEYCVQVIDTVCLIDKSIASWPDLSWEYDCLLYFICEYKFAQTYWQ